MCRSSIMYVLQMFIYIHSTLYYKIHASPLENIDFINTKVFNVFINYIIL
jgi:hypothetical protein